MTITDTSWSNYQIFRVVCRAMLKIAHENAALYTDAINKILAGEEFKNHTDDPVLMNILASRQLRNNEGTNKLYNALVQSQSRLIFELIEYLDHAVGPDDWPGIDLVNFTTRESISNDIGLDFSDIEQEYIDELRKASSQTE